MLMVVFGAGASYDSVPAYPPNGQFADPARPPLANELFADRPSFTEAMSRFPQCQPIVPFLRHLNGKSLERVLEKLQDEGAYYPERYRQIAAVRYYLHFMLWILESTSQGKAAGITNYKTLLDMIERWRGKEEQVCLVTFNYDRLLEQALPSVGVAITSLEHYIGNPRYKIIKVHGSVNWGREVDTDIGIALQIQHQWDIVLKLTTLAPTLNVSRRYQLMNDQAPIALKGNKALFPAIAIPVETKNEFECPDEHLAELTKLLPTVTKMLIIGWRGMDVPFLNLLHKNLKQPANGMIVAGSQSEAEEIGDRLQREKIITPDFNTAEKGFTDFIVSRRGDGFLKS